MDLERYEHPAPPAQGGLDHAPPAPGGLLLAPPTQGGWPDGGEPQTQTNVVGSSQLSGQGEPPQSVHTGPQLLGARAGFLDPVPQPTIPAAPTAQTLNVGYCGLNVSQSSAGNVSGEMGPRKYPQNAVFFTKNVVNTDF